MEEIKDQKPEGPDATPVEKDEKQSKKQHYTRENLYAHIDLTVHQVDVIIACLVALLVIAVTVGIIIK